MRVDVISVRDMTPSLFQRWRELQNQTPEFLSPLVGPDFARLIARYRADTSLAVGYNGANAVAFFPFHAARNGYVRAVGAPFCDYQAIVTDPTEAVSGQEFLKKAGISSFSATSLMDPLGLFDTSGLEDVDAYRIDCSGSSQAHMEALRVANPKWAKNLRRLGNKMERELGPTKLVGFDRSRVSYKAVLDLKVDQFQRTGMTNVLRPAWVRGFMDELFDLQGQDFGGCLVNLYAGEKLVAGQFGVKLGDWFHPWIASTCPASLPYSPGMVFLSETLKEADHLGLRIIDLSAGHGHYKGQFCRDPYVAKAGIVGPNPNSAPSQARGVRGLLDRRLDLIAAVEPDLTGRLSAFGAAVASIPRRVLDRRNSKVGE